MKSTNPATTTTFKGLIAATKNSNPIILKQYIEDIIAEKNFSIFSETDEDDQTFLHYLSLRYLYLPIHSDYLMTANPEIIQLLETAPQIKEKLRDKIYLIGGKNFSALESAIGMGVTHNEFSLANFFIDHLIDVHDVRAYDTMERALTVLQEEITVVTARLEELETQEKKAQLAVEASKRKNTVQIAQGFPRYLSEELLQKRAVLSALQNMQETLKKPFELLKLPKMLFSLEQVVKKYVLTKESKTLTPEQQKGQSENISKIIDTLTKQSLPVLFSGPGQAKMLEPLKATLETLAAIQAAIQQGRQYSTINKGNIAPLETLFSQLQKNIASAKEIYDASREQFRSSDNPHRSSMRR